MTNRSRFLQYLAAALLFTTFMSAALPMLMLPFVDILPYLQTEDFTMRLLLSLLLWAIAILFCLVVSTERQRRDIVSTTMPRWKNVIGAVLGLLMFIAATAAFSANSFGALVKIFPGEIYDSSFEVITAKFEGSRQKSVNLNLRSLENDKVYYLTLSKRLFDYPKFQPGDLLRLVGKENFFGIYIEQFGVKKAG